MEDSFIKWVVTKVRDEGWSFDVCVGRARKEQLFPQEQILSFADEMNAYPRRNLGYATPEEIFEEFLDQVYSVFKLHVS